MCLCVCVCECMNVCVCVCGCVSVFCFLLVGDMLGCFFFISSEIHVGGIPTLPGGCDDTGSCMLLTAFLC